MARSFCKRSSGSFQELRAYGCFYRLGVLLLGVFFWYFQYEPHYLGCILGPLILGKLPYVQSLGNGSLYGGYCGFMGWWVSRRGGSYPPHDRRKTPAQAIDVYNTCRQTFPKLSRYPNTQVLDPKSQVLDL